MASQRLAYSRPCCRRGVSAFPLFIFRRGTQTAFVGAGARRPAPHAGVVLTVLGRRNLGPRGGVFLLRILCLGVSFPLSRRLRAVVAGDALSAVCEVPIVAAYFLLGAGSSCTGAPTVRLIAPYSAPGLPKWYFKTNTQ